MRSDDLAPPTGEFVVARRADDDTVLGGCVGLRRLKDPAGRRVAELRRLYVRPELRGAGLGASLLLCAEEIARVWGVSAMRLDTRLDLGEARALYLRHGWVEVPAFSENDYAEVWYAKRLSGDGCRFVEILRHQEPENLHDLGRRPLARTPGVSGRRPSCDVARRAGSRRLPGRPS